MFLASIFHCIYPVEDYNGIGVVQFLHGFLFESFCKKWRNVVFFRFEIKRLIENDHALYCIRRKCRVFGRSDSQIVQDMGTVRLSATESPCLYRVLYKTVVLQDDFLDEILQIYRFVRFLLDVFGGFLFGLASERFVDVQHPFFQFL